MTRNMQIRTPTQVSLDAKCHVCHLPRTPDAIAAQYVGPRDAGVSHEGFVPKRHGGRKRQGTYCRGTPVATFRPGHRLP